LKPKILGTYFGGGRGGTISGYCNSIMCGNEVPKYAPSMFACFCTFGKYTSSHRGQNNLTGCCLGTSLKPTGSTACPPHMYLGHFPNADWRYFSYIRLIPREVSMNLACIRPYNTSALRCKTSCSCALFLDLRGAPLPPPLSSSSSSSS